MLLSGFWVLEDLLSSCMRSLTKTEVHYAYWILGPWGLLSSYMSSLTRIEVHWA
jgi:hypothetical protein